MVELFKSWDRINFGISLSKRQGKKGRQWHIKRERERERDRVSLVKLQNILCVVQIWKIPMPLFKFYVNARLLYIIINSICHLGVPCSGWHERSLRYIYIKHTTKMLEHNRTIQTALNICGLRIVHILWGLMCVCRHSAVPGKAIKYLKHPNHMKLTDNPSLSEI